jgi:hypothetical protein
MKTAEEVLVKYGYNDFVGCDPPSDLLKAMEEYASTLNREIVEENEKLKSALKDVQRYASELLAYGDSRIGRDALLSSVNRSKALLSESFKEDKPLE